MKRFLLFCLLLVPITIYAQSPWASGKGKGYGQVLYTSIPTYSTLFAGNGNTINTERELSDRTVSAYLDFGINDKVTFSLNIPYVFVKSGSLTEETLNPLTQEGSLNGLGNISLAAKYSFYKKRNFAAGVIFQGDLPTRSFDNQTGLSTGVDAFTFIPKLTAGLSNDDWFVYGYFGYGIRTSNYHHILNYGIEGGLKAAENVSLILNINAINRLDNGDPLVDSETNLATGFYTSIQEYNAFLIKLLVERISGNLGALVSLGGGSGNSVAASPAISIGLFYKW